MNFKYTLLSVWFLSFLFSVPITAQFQCELDKQPETIFPQSKITSISCSHKKDKSIVKVKWMNGAKYRGSFDRGELNGNGVFVFPEQYTYSGEFKNGEMHGIGSIKYENDYQYDGQWIAGKKEGRGALSFSCGLEYLGEFKNDKMHGEGVIRMSEEESFSGTWVEGVIEGEGLHIKSDGSKFIGRYENDERNGEGMIVWETRDTMKGIWKNGFLEGQSRFQFADGSVIIQFWKSGKVEQAALFVQENGFYITGTPEVVIQQIVNSELNNNSRSVENNFSLAWYSAAMEYKSQQDFDGAAKQLQIARSFINPYEDSGLAELVTQELKFIEIEKERHGVAKKEEEKKRQ